MRCSFSLFFFVSLIVSSYAAPVPSYSAGGVLTVRNHKVNGATPQGGVEYDLPRRKRDGLPGDSEILPSPEVLPKKPRSNSRLSDSKHRPKQIAADLKAAETKRETPREVPQTNPVAATPHPQIDLVTSEIKKVLTGRDSVLKRDDTSVAPVGSSSEGGDLTPRRGPLGRDNAPTSSGVTSFTTPGWIERILNGNGGAPTYTRDAPDVDLAARDTTTDTPQPPVHVDGAVISHPVAVHKRDGDEPSIA